VINQPEAHDLLTEARRVLLESLAPELTGERKYEALMIANAMGMAIRELEFNAQNKAEEADRAVLSLLETHGLPGHNVECESSLADAVRERQLEGGSVALRKVLRTLTEARLGINSPGYLKR